MREYAAVENKFAQMGLSLSEDDIANNKSWSDQMWGYMGTSLTEMGISQSSYETVLLNSEKRSQLFESIYGEGGEKAVAEAEIRDYMLDRYAMIDYIDIELKDGEGNLLKS